MTELFANYKIASRENDDQHQIHHQHRRDRRQFYRQMEDFLDVWVKYNFRILCRSVCSHLNWSLGNLIKMRKMSQNLLYIFFQRENQLIYTY
jgi:hypothetical protein